MWFISLFPVAGVWFSFKGVNLCRAFLNMNPITNVLSGEMGVKEHCSLPVAAQDVAFSKPYLLSHYLFSLIFNTLSCDLFILQMLCIFHEIFLALGSYVFA